MSKVIQNRVVTLETEAGVAGAFTAVLAAAGSADTDAAQITKTSTVVTGADNAKGVALPAAALGISRYVHNSSATAHLLVYPYSGGNDNINGLAEDLPYTMLPGEGRWFEATSATQWYVATNFGVGQIARASAQFDAVTGTTGSTLTNVTGLVLPVVAGSYEIDIDLGTVATSNCGLKVGLKFGTASMLTSIEYQAMLGAAASIVVSRGTTATDAASIIASTTAILNARIRGSMIVASAGTLQLQAAQNAAHADTTSVFVGSTMKFTRFA